MKKKNKSNTGTLDQSSFWTARLSEGGFILLTAAALFVLIALATYPANPADSDMTRSLFAGAHFASGALGLYIAEALYFLLGYMAYFLSLAIIYFGFIWFTNLRYQPNIAWVDLSLRAVNLILLMLSGAGLCYLLLDAESLSHLSGGGGLVGRIVTDYLIKIFGLAGSLLFLFAVYLTGLTGLTGISWFKLTEWVGYITLWFFRQLGSALQFFIQLLSSLRRILSRIATRIFAKRKTSLQALERKQVLKILEPKREIKPKPIPQLFTARKEKSLEPVPIIQSTANLIQSSIATEKKRAVSDPMTGYLPSLALLDKGEPGKPLGGYTHQALESQSREVEQYLLDFGIQADVVAVHPGPVITRFELQLAAGIKVSRLSGLAKDLARSLSVTSVRIVEVIPGKTVVGLELPNQHREMVRLSQVLESDVYQQAQSPLALALGVDIAGHPMVVDLAKMPHLLVAGTTGSGKSVGINAMILSLIFKSTPEQVRLIMVDPKMLELSVYEGIPHLLTPVVTDMKEAASALRWCVGEMERRYRLMAAVGVRNLAGFNSKVTGALAAGEPMRDPLWRPTDSMQGEAPFLETLPYIVVIIDELADMMMVVGKKVEQLIARIAQKARAAGIHLILATQRPSVDVLTGLIKSNIPTRISFQVSSKIDSRTILDQQGAESLLGHGDMLYLAPGTGAPLRVHGAFVDDAEVHRVADDWRARGEPCYLEEITQSSGDLDGENPEEGRAVEEADALYDQAVEFVVQSRKASISAVQRRFKIGYNRSARLIEEMERVGIVGPLEGGMRDVLVSGHDED